MIYYDMPDYEYRALPGFGSTDIKNILRSYLHMEAERKTFKQTPAMRLGTAFHCSVLEPERFGETYKIMPEFSGTGSRAKKEEWCLNHADFQFLSQDEMDTIDAMWTSLSKHDAAFNLLLDCKQREVSLTWKEPLDANVSAPMKARFDGLTPYCIVDLKTTLDASPEAFGRQACNMNYLVQAAHYMKATATESSKFPDFTFIAVEKEPPYGVGVYKVTTDQYLLGSQLRQKALDRILDQHYRPKTTAYSHQLQNLQYPAWGYRQD